MKTRRGVVRFDSQSQSKMHGIEHATRKKYARYIGAIRLQTSLFIALAADEKKPARGGVRLVGS